MCQYKDKEWLTRKYSEEGLSLHQIGKLCGVDAKNIQYWMRKFKLPTRSKSDAVVKYFESNKKHYQNTCENCFKSFTVDTLSKTRPDSKAFIKYCSDSCRTSARVSKKVMYKRDCPHCGKSFDCTMKCMTNPEASKFKKYCSQKCVLAGTKKADTWIEREIEEHLKDSGIEYVQQFRVGRFTVDFLIPDKSLVIEANGDFWHANPDIYSNGHLYKMQEMAVEKDKRKLARLNAEGYTVLVVWENDLSTRKDETLRAIVESIYA